MARADELNAELRVVELEERLVRAKESGDLSDEQLRELKLQLREARRGHRELREGRGPDEGEARPDTVSASAQVEE